MKFVIMKLNLIIYMYSVLIEMDWICFLLQICCHMGIVKINKSINFACHFK